MILLLLLLVFKYFSIYNSTYYAYTVYACIIDLLFNDIL